MSHIVKNLKKIKASLLPNVKLIVVSKYHTVEEILEAYQAGERHFGENRIPELESKVVALREKAPDIVWHLIGTLQKNKVKKALELAHYIHSVDSIELLERLERLASEMNVKREIFAELNVSGERSKHGFDPKDLSSFLECAKTCQHVRLMGLMTMAPAHATDLELHTYFELLHQLQIQAQLTELSMGMSGDYLIAMQHGATFVRIGSAIFAE